MIPTISLADDGAGGELVAAFAQFGFASVVDHGVDPTVRRSIFDASAAFHALPIEAKSTIGLDSLHRGFIAMDVSTDRASSVTEAQRPNRSESFMVMREDGPTSVEVRNGNYLAGPNQWPEGLPGFRDTVETYQEVMIGLGRRVLALFERGLGLAPGRLGSAFATPTTWLRLLHYPPVPLDAEAELYGSAPHRDFGALTFLAQDHVGGLEVRAPDGRWLEVSPNSDAFVVNVGDMLHRWTNGELLSTPHRVDNRSGRERYSVPFFFDPHVNTVIAPLPECVDRTGGSPRFEPLMFAHFLREQLEASYDRHQPGARTTP